MFFSRSEIPPSIGRQIDGTYCIPRTLIPSMKGFLAREALEDACICIVKEYVTDGLCKISIPSDWSMHPFRSRSRLVTRDSHLWYLYDELGRARAFVQGRNRTGIESFTRVICPFSIEFKDMDQMITALIRRHGARLSHTQWILEDTPKSRALLYNDCITHLNTEYPDWHFSSKYW